MQAFLLVQSFYSQNFYSKFNTIKVFLNRFHSFCEWISQIKYLAFKCTLIALSVIEQLRYFIANLKTNHREYKLYEQPLNDPVYYF